jgi:hypothetical protein
MMLTPSTAGKDGGHEARYSARHGVSLLRARPTWAVGPRPLLVVGRRFSEVTSHADR